MEEEIKQLHGQTMEDCTSTDNFPYPATTFNFVTHFYVTQFDFEDNDTISYLLLLIKY